jgi:negative regulator of sigma E activity
MPAKTKQPKTEKRRSTHAVRYNKGVTFNPIGVTNIIKILRSKKSVVYAIEQSLYSDNTKSLTIKIDNIPEDAET